MMIPFSFRKKKKNSYLNTFEANYMGNVFVNIKYIAIFFIKKLIIYFFLVP